ncbi:hypothetical protein RJT34_24288 [Clitoria ternatea]|uniref:Uncharacterized protein n=1 Tax=Clitoria ternatea TaxID=43366 RepID=A0AAN9FML8_CLITE
MLCKFCSLSMHNWDLPVLSLRTKCYATVQVEIMKLNSKFALRAGINRVSLYFGITRRGSSDPVTCMSDWWSV